MRSEPQPGRAADPKETVDLVCGLGIIGIVKTVLISEVKAKCIQMLKEVQKNGKPLTVTLRGKPLVRIEPATEEPKRVRLGALKGWGQIKGDIVHGDFEKDWE